MVIPSSAFIQGRVGELDLIAAGWRYMQRTMNDDDRRGFERMVNMPGFCVKKFEETYLLKKINPFAQTEEDRIISFSHSDCPCGTHSEPKAISDIKGHVLSLTEKLDNVFKCITGSQTLSKATNFVNNDNENFTSGLHNFHNANHDDKKANPENERPLAISNSSDGRKQRITDLTVKTANVVEGQCLGYVDQLFENQVEKRQAEASCAFETTPKPYCVNLNSGKKQGGTENKKPKVFKISANLSEVNSESIDAEKEECSQGEPISVICTEEVARLSSPAHSSSGSRDNGRCAGSPDSGITLDISDGKALDDNEKANTLVKEKASEKFIGRDERRQRHKLRDAEKLAITQNQLKINEKLSRTDEEGSSNKKIGKANCEPATVTGKEKRRLKDKLRRELKKKENLQESEKNMSENLSDDVDRLTDLSEIIQKRKDRQDTVSVVTLKGDKSDQNTDKVDETNETNYILENDIRNTMEDENNQITRNYYEIDQNGSTTFEFLPGEYRIGQTDEVDEIQSSNLTFQNQSVDNKQGTTGFLNNTSTTSQEKEIQKNSLNKSQKKRVRNKASKGVYVVNDQGTHSIELLPGEYKIVQFDQNREIEEVSFNNISMRETNDRSDESNKHQNHKAKNNKKKNYYVAGNLSQNILDTGKWLAYVIDEKNPDAAPKFGEVTTEQVEETFKMIGSQMSQKGEQELEDKLMYNCEYNSRNAKKTAKHDPTRSKTVLPELDADFLRKSFAEFELDSPVEPTEMENGTDIPDGSSDDLQIYLNSFNTVPEFHSQFARKTASLMVNNYEFREFCVKYANSKYDSKTISRLIKKYIDARIVFHYERFKKLADRESHRISKCWSKIHENSPYALMVMLYINSPTTSVGFMDVEAALFELKAIE